MSMKPSLLTTLGPFVVAAIVPAAKARAQDSSADPSTTECVIVADPDDDGPIVGWSYDADGNVQNEVWVQAMDAEGVSYQLTGRLSFAGHRVEWSQEAETADAAETVFLPLSLPNEAHISELQATYLSDLVVRVFAVDGDGDVIARRRLARVKVVWPEGSEPPVIMDEEMAAAGAPFGIYDAAALAEVLATADGSDDVVNIYGPLAVVVPEELPPATVEDVP